MTTLEAGQGKVEITPPLGIEMAGFHRPPGQERRVEGIRAKTFARALVLRSGDSRAAIVSLEVVAISQEFAQAVKAAVEQETGIPAAHVLITATHSHSTPPLRFCRQWGAEDQTYRNRVAAAAREAVAQGIKDLSPSNLYLGKQRVVGGNFNRTTPSWRTDEEFGPESTDADRWLDTTLHCLYFVRTNGKGDLAWHHFCAHPVCFTDGLAGPDWPGMVAERICPTHSVDLGFLQGHIGDVNPGDGTPWIGDPEETTGAVLSGLHHALGQGRLVPVKDIRVQTERVELPLNIALLQEWIETYRKDPAACKDGLWVDARFAEDWARAAEKLDLSRTTLSTSITTLIVGDVALLFHASELYSYYGLAIRRDSPFPDTLVVGFTDDEIGYLPDPAAYEKEEYAAIVVPKILDLPPFAPNAASVLKEAAVGLLKKV